MNTTILPSPVSMSQSLHPPRHKPRRSTIGETAATHPYRSLTDETSITGCIAQGSIQVTKARIGEEIEEKNTRVRVFRWYHPSADELPPSCASPLHAHAGFTRRPIPKSRKDEVVCCKHPLAALPILRSILFPKSTVRDFRIRHCGFTQTRWPDRLLACGVNMPP